MRRARQAAVGILAALVAAGAAWSFTARRIHEAHFDNVMGTSLAIRIQARSDAAAREAEAAVLDEIARLSAILSGYDPDSEFSRWMRSARVPTKVSPELIDVLSAFDEWRTRTSAALDPSVEAASRVWKLAARENRLPTGAELNIALAQVRQRHWVVDRRSSTVTRTSDAPVVLNSFTKSYIVDRAARRALSVAGVRGVLIDAGGDIVTRGGWTQTIGVASPHADARHVAPRERLAIRDAVVATSGGYKRGIRYRPDAITRTSSIPVRACGGGRLEPQRPAVRSHKGGRAVQRLSGGLSRAETPPLPQGLAGVK